MRRALEGIGCFTGGTCTLRTHCLLPAKGLGLAMKRLRLILGIAACLLSLLGAAKPKVVNFGRWMTVKWLVGAQEEKALELKIRPLMVNGEAKFFSIGESHDITQQLFVV